MADYRECRATSIEADSSPLFLTGPMERMLVQRIGHPKSTPLKRIQKGTDSRNVPSLLGSKNQPDSSENSQFEI